ncbi:caspase family protein [Morganella sp. Je.2.23]|uniref:caspase family protein n=1 Tax=Morganella sp. Je.2.23 TaxID=3142840 RepID=UPI003DA970D7
MKRKALIIANADGLPGVDVDVTNIRTFLTSISGGGWFDDEIEILRSPLKSNLISKLSGVRGCYDFTIVFFAGHGGNNRGRNLLFLNSYNEYITDSDISNLSERQINIIDCCRSPVADYELVKLSESCVAGLESYSDEYLSLDEARAKYEERVKKSPTQQVTLYACSEGEYSSDTKNGGLYTSAFLEKAANCNKKQAFQTALACHTAISSQVTMQAQKFGNNQHPDFSALRVVEDKQLIISINPISLVHLFS